MKKTKLVLLHSLYYPDIIGGAEISTQILAETLHDHYNISVITVGSHKSKSVIRSV